ncbi:hypothetical protein VDGL01_12153 [Verticillium dahliae]
MATTRMKQYPPSPYFSLYPSISLSMSQASSATRYGADYWGEKGVRMVVYCYWYSTFSLCFMGALTPRAITEL